MFTTHHCGSCVPYFAGRIEMQYGMYKVREGITDDFARPVLDYYKMLYGDTALHGNAAALMCGYNFFGADHILFGTDMPFGTELGAWAVRKTIDAVEKLDITDPDKKNIYEGNIRRLLNLPNK